MPANPIFVNRSRSTDDLMPALANAIREEYEASSTPGSSCRSTTPGCRRSGTGAPNSTSRASAATPRRSSTCSNASWQEPRRAAHERLGRIPACVPVRDP